MISIIRTMILLLMVVSAGCAPKPLPVSIPGPVAGAPEGEARIMDGQDIQLTFSVSAMWQATERARFGAMYLGEVDIEFDSDLRLTLPPGQLPEDIAADVAFTYGTGDTTAPTIDDRAPAPGATYASTRSVNASGG